MKNKSDAWKYVLCICCSRDTWHVEERKGGGTISSSNPASVNALSGDAGHIEVSNVDTEWLSCVDVRMICHLHHTNLACGLFDHADEVVQCQILYVACKHAGTRISGLFCCCPTLLVTAEQC